MGKGLRGQVVVVTGASSGVGRAIARAFGAAGARVGLIARTREALENCAAEIREAGGEALVLPLDVADAVAVERASDEVVKLWGHIDIWVNDAMVGVFAPVHQTTPDEFRRVTEVNYLGYVHGTLAALKHMRHRNMGHIIMVSSALAYRSIPLQSSYCATKAAVRGFTDSLRCELHHEKSGIQVSALQLPAVNTPQFDVVRSRLPDHPQPVPPIYQPEVIARAAVYVAKHPTREFWIGWSTVKAILGQRVIPGLLDRYLATKAYGGQQTDLPVTTGRPDNVDTPLPGDRGAHGSFDDRARSHSSEAWLRRNRLELAVTLLAAAGVGAWMARERLE